MERLRLRTADAELIKNRLTFQSRKTSARSPIGLLLSARRENNNREKETNGACGAKPQQQKKHRGGRIFPSFQNKMKGYDGVFHAC